MFAGYVAHTRIERNDIADTSNGAITLGWGWGIKNTMQNNSVKYNQITRSNTKLYVGHRTVSVTWMLCHTKCIWVRGFLAWPVFPAPYSHNIAGSNVCNSEGGMIVEVWESALPAMVPMGRWVITDRHDLVARAAVCRWFRGNIC